MTRRRRIARWMSVLVAAAVAVVAPVPALTPAAQAADPGVPTVPANYLAQTVSWTDCPGDLESRCARVRVPMDWKNPARGNISIAIAYLPASGTSKGA